jgi:hypothetical protein
VRSGALRCCLLLLDDFLIFFGSHTVGKTMSPSPGPQEKHHFLVGGMVTIPKWVVKMAIVLPTLPKTYWGWSLIWWIPKEEPRSCPTTVVVS